MEPINDYEKKKIINDIRNLKNLDKNTISKIKNFSETDKMEIIMVYNDIMETVETILS